MRLSVFILVSMAASALALKGETSTSTAKAPGSIRRLQPGPPKDKEGPGSKQPPPPKEDAAPKEDKKAKDKEAKEDKKAKDNKKCKKAKKDVKKRRVLAEDKAGGAPDPKEKMPKAPKNPSTGDEADPAGTEPPAMAPVMQPDAADVVEGDADSPYCLQSTLSAEQCEAIRSGELPVSAKTAKGLVTLELSYDTDQEDALDTVEDILRTKTPTKFVGCPETFRFLEEEEGGDEVMDTEEDPYVSGLEFGEFTISGEGTYQFSSAINVH